MASSSAPRSSRKLNGMQFAAILAAIALVASLIGALAAGLALPVAGAAGAVVKAVPETFREMPSDLEVIAPSEESRLLDADGRVMARFYSERRTIVNSDQIAPIMKEAIVSIEDRRFFTHHGIDPEGMARALVNNLTTGGTQGASTITQQYVKMMLLEKGLQAGDQDLIDSATEVSAERKLREARYAIALESTLTKDEILTGYLNLAPFGQNIYGVEAASRAFFSKSANDLTPGEAALLAGATNQPTYYDPTVNPEAAQARRDVVLGEMLEEGFITQEEYDQAVAQPVADMLNPSTSVSGCSAAGTGAYFCRYAVETFLRDEAFGGDRAEREKLLYTGGLTLRSTLVPKDQDAAYQAAVDRVPVGDGSELNVALVSVVPETGHIVAMAQNTPYGPPTPEQPTATEVSFSVDAAHGGGGNGFQVGSTFKIFILVQWFYEGRSAYEIVGGSNYFPPYSFHCNGQSIYTELWEPGESEASKAGASTVLEATRNSVNQAFGDMATRIDFCQIFERAKAMGVTDAEGEAILPVPGNLLGSSDATPLDMASAFGVLANNGTKCSPMALTEVEDREGTIVKSYVPECENAIDPSVAKQVTNVMAQAVQTMTFQLDRPWAGKSGTTDNNANVWYVGFTPELSTAVWAGFANDSSRPGQSLVVNGQYIDYLYGGPFLGATWAQYMTQALAGTPATPFDQVFVGIQPQPQPSSSDSTSQGGNNGDSNDGPGRGNQNDGNGGPSEEGDTSRGNREAQEERGGEAEEVSDAGEGGGPEEATTDGDD